MKIDLENFTVSTRQNKHEKPAVYYAELRYRDRVIASADSIQGKGHATDVLVMELGTMVLRLEEQSGRAGQ